MNKNNLSVSTITWARDAVEENLLRKSLAVLANFNIPVFVCDGGSGNDFLNFLKSFPHFTLIEPSVKGVCAQAKSAVIAAYQQGSGFTLYTEPDKLDFFRHNLAHFVSNAPLQAQTGVVLASRSEKAFSTFPGFQQTTEATINKCCNEIIGKLVDYTYGPFLLNRKLIPFFEMVQEDIGWGWRPYMFGIAKRLGYDVEAVEDNLTCPTDQQKDTPGERVYRMKQLIQNIQGLVLSTSIKI